MKENKIDDINDYKSLQNLIITVNEFRSVRTCTFGVHL